MNLPNKLSMARVAAVPPFLLCLYAGTITVGNSPALAAAGEFTALALVIVVSITDWLDGHLARKHRLVSNLGKLLDPLADKIFVAAALVALVELSQVPAWAVVLILAREFAVTGLRALAADRGRVISADRLGKHKMAWQLALILCAILGMAIRNTLLCWPQTATPSVLDSYDMVVTILLWVVLGVTVYLTVVSGWLYVARNADLLKDEPTP